MKWLHWTLLLLSLLLDLTRSSGEEKAEKIIRALGESVTFQLKVSEPFTIVMWMRTKGNGVPSVVALLKPGENCETTIILPDFEGQLNVSRDCKRLQVKNLNQDDSGAYQAQIQIQKGEPLNLFFDLHVYKRLSEADLSILCKGTGDGTWWVSCSAEPWEDGMKFGMALSDQGEDLGRTFAIRKNLEESNVNVTCTAENPVSNASRMASLKEICDAPIHSLEQPFKTQTDHPETKEFIPKNHDPRALIGTTTALALIVAKVFISGCVFARWPCCSLGRREGYRKGTRPRRTI